MTKIIALDAGHGKETPGKRSPDGEREWYFNDKMLRACQKWLTDKYEGVKIVRTDDPSGKVDVTLAERVKRANNAKADIFVSFHNNALAGKWGSHGGTETYIASPASANPKSNELAKKLHPRVVKALKLKDRGIKSANYYVLMNTNMPAVLIEGGFMDSTIDIKVLRNDKELEDAGIQVAEGIADYFNLKQKPKPTTPPPSTDKDVYRVIVDGKQIGAFSAPGNALAEVEKAIKADKKKIELERV